MKIIRYLLIFVSARLAHQVTSAEGVNVHTRHSKMELQHSEIQLQLIHQRYPLNTLNPLEVHEVSWLLVSRQSQTNHAMYQQDDTIRCNKNKRLLDNQPPNTRYLNLCYFLTPFNAKSVFTVNSTNVSARKSPSSTETSQCLH